MTTTEFLEREIRRAEISLRHAQRKPNTPEEELRGLYEKIEHLREALDAVKEHWQLVHEAITGFDECVNAINQIKKRDKYEHQNAAPAPTNVNGEDHVRPPRLFTQTGRKNGRRQ